MRTKSDESTIELLEHEDKDIQRLFRLLMATRGQSVEERYRHGRLAKQLVRHVANREAALTEVSRSMGQDESLRESLAPEQNDTRTRRMAINRVEHMSRGKQGMYLNTGQDFEGALEELAAIIGPEIGWELREAIPALQKALADEGASDMLRSARYVSKHAPTKLNPLGPRWHERAPILSRLLTIYDHLRDFPRPSKGDGRE
jgi:hypothetical protein